MSLSHFVNLAEYRPDMPAARARFQFRHVEPLLNQCADILDRCLSELRYGLTLHESWVRFSSTLASDIEELRLDIERNPPPTREVDIARRRSEFFAQSQGNWETSAREAQKLYNYSSGESQGMAGWTRAGQNNEEKKVANIARDIEREVARIQIESAVADQVYHSGQVVYRQADIDRRRMESVPGGLLDLVGQRNLVFERVQRDYEDALNRAAIAAEGLDLIYGYTPERGPARPMPAESASPSAAISHLANWVRSAIEWLVAQGQVEQAFTDSVSVRTKIGEAGWKQLQKKGMGEILLTLTPKMYDYMYRNVRLRGISASLVGVPAIVPWTILVTLPPNGAYHRGEDVITVAQPSLRCNLGRVESRQSIRAPEVCGQITLLNASPLSASLDDFDRLRIEVSPPYPNPVNAKDTIRKLEDIVMELSLVGLPHQS